mgnify:CR=1 FL=1
MDSTTFKPYTYDPQFFIDKQAATAATLSAADVNDVVELPLSSFYNYTAAEQNLNQITQQTGVTNFIGNQLAYVSAGETTGSYTTGVLTNPTNPQRDLLNRYHPTVNFKPNTARHTREQLGGHLLPHNVAVLNYISIQPRFRVLTDKLTPGVTYVVADPSIYGGGQGNNSMLVRSSPVDHDENVTWIKSPPVYAGQTGRIINSQKQANFCNYTSFEQTIGAPKHGVCKFTDNFDFFAGSVSGDVWANDDVYKLTEANKYDMVNRQRDLLTDICDSPYRWRTDIYGNEYMFYKLGTQLPKRTAGGSDTDDDGRDDEINPGQGLSDYYQQEIDQEGVFINSNTSVTYGGGAPQDGGGFAPTDPGDDTPAIEDPNPIYDDPTETQLDLADCDFFLYGGDSLSPENSATNLDMTYRFQTINTQAQNEYTVAGAVSAIIDGGWRSQHAQQNSSGDQHTNQFEETITVPLESIINGFFDGDIHAVESGTFDPNNDEVSWLPDWTRNTNDTRRFPNLLPSSESDPSFTFTYSTDVTNSRLHDWSYVSSQLSNTPRTESNETFPYVIADGGWYRANKSSSSPNTFFRTQCDRASYILARYGQSGVPDFGNHIFACKMFEITDDPVKYMPLAESAYDGDTKRYDNDLKYAKQRGPLNALHFRNPVEWSVGVQGRFGRNIQFFGTVERLREWKAAIGISGTARAGLARLPEDAFDYLTLGEYYHMRISSIEGSGTKIDDTRTFLDTDTSGKGIQSDGRARYLGTPDIFYYVNDGTIDYQDVINDIPITKTAEYANVSGDLSYIHSYSTDENINLNDIGSSAATQFPQVRHDVSYTRSTNVSVQDYNNSSCENVSEFRIYQSANVVGGVITDATPTVQRTVRDTHPVAEYHNQVFVSKRGYFPPPVGHLRRTQTFPGAGTPVALQGRDEPIPHNLLPAPGDDQGFYVHDVWDGAGFIFQAGADQTSVTQEKPSGVTEREAQLGEDNLAPIKYIPNTDTVVTIDGDLVANLGCGGYTGYFNVTSVAISPYLKRSGEENSDVEIPLGSVAQMVKRASDSVEDMCYVSVPPPTLWQQKHQTTQLAPATATNIVIRNLYSDSIILLSEIVSSFAQQFNDDIISPSRAFIDMDVINDILVLRQADSTGLRETYTLDQVKFDYSTGNLTLGQLATHSVTTSSDPRSSLIGHYYNEDDNCLIVGYTHAQSSTLIYPVLYKLDLSTHQWSEIYSGQQDQEEFQLSQSDFGSNLIDYEIKSIDPGEISFNTTTNNYCVTYFAEVVPESSPVEHPGSLAIFNHTFENTPSQLQLITATMFHSQNKDNDLPVLPNISDHTEQLRLTQSGNRGAAEPAQSPIDMSTSSSTYNLTLNLEDLDGTVELKTASTRPIQLHVDWGDGEHSTIYSDYFNDNSRSMSFRRYGAPGSRVKVSENTVLKTPVRYDGTSLSQHKLVHTYRFSQSGTTTATVSCYMNDQTTNYNNTLNIEYVSSDINDSFSGVKLINTKLYSSSDTTKQHLLMTLETQDPRLVAYNIIDINT